jgi:hypothetical protein
LEGGGRCRMRRRSSGKRSARLRDRQRSWGDQPQNQEPRAEPRAKSSSGPARRTSFLAS